jgi:hypothetical protein
MRLAIEPLHTGALCYSAWVLGRTFCTENGRYCTNNSHGYWRQYYVLWSAVSRKLAGDQNVHIGPLVQTLPPCTVSVIGNTWLFDSEVLHRGSLGSEQLVRPGQLSLMTAGDS